jgi:hypothetical protein
MGHYLDAIILATGFGHDDMGKKKAIGMPGLEISLCLKLFRFLTLAMFSVISFCTTE